MHLADIHLLKSEEIQLLADSLQPVFVLELTPVAETLIQHELLRAFPAICQHSKRACFVLTTTDMGAAYVAAWIEGPTKQHVCETCAERGRPNVPVYKMGMCTFCYHGKPHPEATSKQVARERIGASEERRLYLVQRESCRA